MIENVKVEGIRLEGKEGRLGGEVKEEESS